MLRLIVTFCVLATTAALADTIHLKNGRSIVADSVREKSDRVEYDIGEDSYAIPKSSVERIEAGVGVPTSGSATAAVNLAPPTLEVHSADDSPSAEITPEVLDRLEKSGNTRALSDALSMLAIREQKSGQPEDARMHLERALNLMPQNGNLSALYAWLLIQQQSASQAESYAEDAVRKEPQSGFAHKVLGLAYYDNDKIAQSVEEFKAAKQLLPRDTQVDYYLRTSMKQAKAEANFQSDASTHFNMRYEGDQASPRLRQQILDVLEQHFNDLVSSMGLLPRDPIVVVLYTNQTFFDVTQAPSWTAALNDGKLRIPIEGLTEVTPELSRVLKHELAHSFIKQATNGRCPVWLNEGYAQLVEPRSASQYRTQLARLFASGREAPLQVLEGSFIGYDSQHAAIAYVESLAYVEYIRDTYGVSRIGDMMRYLSEGESPEEALKSAIHDDYSQLQDEFVKQLQ